jgi:YidC/Oxa1 family membrane protein insertase
MPLLNPALFAVYHVVYGLAAVLVPLLGGFGPAAAIVVFTAAVRACLYPLNRAQMRAQAASSKARAALEPAVRRLQRKYRNDPRRLQLETVQLYRANGVSLAPGILHGLAQIPVFFVIYRMFESPIIAGHRNGLMSSRLFGVDLGSRLAAAFRGPAPAAAHVAVFALLMAVIAATATWTCLRARKSPATTPPPVAASPSSERSTALVGRLVTWLPYWTVVTAALVPLATGLYLATTTLWTAVERRHLQKSTTQAARG